MDLVPMATLIIHRAPVETIDNTEDQMIIRMVPNMPSGKANTRLAEDEASIRTAKTSTRLAADEVNNPTAAHIMIDLQVPAPEIRVVAATVANLQLRNLMHATIIVINPPRREVEMINRPRQMAADLINPQRREADTINNKAHQLQDKPPTVMATVKIAARI